MKKIGTLKLQNKNYEVCAEFTWISDDEMKLTFPTKMYSQVLEMAINNDVTFSATSEDLAVYICPREVVYLANPVTDIDYSIKEING